jgi:integrase
MRNWPISKRGLFEAGAERLADVARKATGTVRLRDGRWEVGLTVDGKRRFRRCPPRIKTEAGAREYGAWMLEQIKAGRNPFEDPEEVAAPPAAEGETFEAWSERWLTHRTHVRGLKSVVDDAGRLRNHVWPILGAKPIAGITSDDLEVVRDALDSKVREGKIAWKTAWNTWGIVTVAFGAASRSKDRTLRVRSDNPALGLEGPDRGSRLARQYLYPSEFLRFVSYPDVPLRWRRLVTLAIYTGLRAGEIRALTWGDVDLEHLVISVTKAYNRKTRRLGTTKTDETRRIPIEAELVPLLHSMRQDIGVVKSEQVTWMPHYDDCGPLVRRYLRVAGVTRKELLYENSKTTRALTFHDLRATCLTWMAVRGDEPLRIQQRAGHRNFGTTQQYIREAEHLRTGFGDPFPPLPYAVLYGR